jgi:hypothetical protein
MNGQRMLISVLIVVLLLALAGGVLVAQRPQSPDEDLSVDETDAVGANIPIQGRLTDASGSPLTGSHSIMARIYDDSTGGTTLCSDTDTVAVDNCLAAVAAIVWQAANRRESREIPAVYKIAKAGLSVLSPGLGSVQLVRS